MIAFRTQRKIKIIFKKIITFGYLLLVFIVLILKFKEICTQFKKYMRNMLNI